MQKEIDYLDNLSGELAQLSGLCDVLCCVGESNREPTWESAGHSFRAIQDVLDQKIAEIEKIVSEWYKAQAGETAHQP